MKRIFDFIFYNEKKKDEAKEFCCESLLLEQNQIKTVLSSPKLLKFVWDNEIASGKILPKNVFESISLKNKLKKEYRERLKEIEGELLNYPVNMIQTIKRNRGL